MIYFDFSQPDEDNSNLHLTPGVVNFRIVKVDDKPSAAGNPMITVWLLITDSKGEKATIKDRFVLIEKCKWRTKEFLLSVGDFQRTASRLIDGDTFLAREGKCIILLEVATDDKYSDKMVIDKYIEDPMYANSSEKESAQERQKVQQKSRRQSKKQPDDLEEPNDDLGAEWFVDKTKTT